MGYLERILQSYSNDFVTPQVIESIRGREVSSDFPFSIHNMMRAFLNMSESFFLGYWIYFNLHQKDNLDSVASGVGTATRLYRYTMILLIGAWINNEINWNEKINFLEWIAKVLCNKIDNELTLPVPRAKQLYDSLITAVGRCKLQSIEISQLATTLKEYVDFLLLGEHPVGYVTYPPVRYPPHTMVVREYTNLDYAGFIQNIKRVRIVDTYDIAFADKMKFNLFRGNLYGIPSYHERVAGQVVVNEELIFDSDRIKQILNAINQGFIKRSEYYSISSTHKLEVEQALIYTNELQSLFGGKLPEQIEKEINESVQSNKIGFKMKQIFRNDTYTDLYFKALEESIRTIEDFIK